MYSLLLAVIYLAFISLGLPDSLLGAAWPTMYIEFGVPVSYAGAVSVMVATSVQPTTQRLYWRTCGSGYAKAFPARLWTCF